MAGYKADTDAFVSWLTADANVKLSQNIEVTHFNTSNEGRGVIAVKDIAEGEVLFEIPRDSILNVLTSSLSSDFSDLEETLQSIGSWEGLILCLLYEWKGKKEKSKWWKYFNVLPSSNAMNGLMYWNEQELEHLRPSLVLDRIGKKSAKNMYHKVLTLVKESKFPEVLCNVEWEDFVYAASVIMAYSFDVENGESQTLNEEDDDQDEEENTGYIKSMIPLADTLNSDTHQCNANLMYDDKFLKMYAIKPIKKGEQVFNIYGNHPNAEILRRYGYVEWSGSAYDFGEVLLGNIEQALLETFSVPKETLDMCIETLKKDEIISDILENEDIVLDSYDCYYDGTVETDCVVLVVVMSTLLQTPNIAAMDNTTLTMHLRRVVKKCVQLVERGSISESCNKVWQKAVSFRLKDYSNRDFSDPELQSIDFEDKSKLRAQMANVVLKGEVECLSSCFGSFSKQFKIIDDKKLLDNILKRKADTVTNSKNKNKGCKRSTEHYINHGGALYKLYKKHY
ncbi:hypothetical protein KAFR_0H00600 [Kazachstania africana CBS 2517]|uniref:SET domain-containing protein n=1 Tax=Kazachstania africana (strain ATCC 22294 / BCRC 22015 / CBS 2517 / CECT 1963 / NBRC 1671 / NRRL Y-8276) TaxID=1071382 RepID=H2AYR3_KAZAF|nr:hypothetical protein KAFR_0H00600 [Kazachstania africana CBS 2517]CCF59469.1 hypothetical protein KAFR_0H00600 [Kazachstania africana CBS 2517]